CRRGHSSLAQGARLGVVALFLVGDARTVDADLAFLAVLIGGLLGALRLLGGLGLALAVDADLAFLAVLIGGLLGALRLDAATGDADPAVTAVLLGGLLLALRPSAEAVLTDLACRAILLDGLLGARRGRDSARALDAHELGAAVVVVVALGFIADAKDDVVVEGRGHAGCPGAA